MRRLLLTLLAILGLLIAFATPASASDVPIPVVRTSATLTGTDSVNALERCFKRTGFALGTGYYRAWACSGLQGHSTWTSNFGFGGEEDFISNAYVETRVDRLDASDGNWYTTRAKSTSLYVTNHTEGTTTHNSRSCSNSTNPCPWNGLETHAPGQRYADDVLFGSDTNYYHTYSTATVTLRLFGGGTVFDHLHIQVPRLGFFTFKVNTP
jgi:hypothetical protein